MRTGVIASLTGACLAVLALGQPALANILINVDKTTQTMNVVVDGWPRYNWKVATGGMGYDTPNGTFTIFRMDEKHRSKEWNNAPMPYAMFFTTTGIAIHGTYERGLGRPVSHGCVRLSVQDAQTLWDLVTREHMQNAIVQVTGTSPVRGVPIARGYGGPMFARSGPIPPAAIGSMRDVPPPPPPNGRDAPRPLFPFFAFGQ